MKNILKKSLLFAAFALVGSAIVPMAQAAVTRIEDITEQNIVEEKVQRYITDTLSEADEIFSTFKVADAQMIIQKINDKNIKDIDGWLILKFLTWERDLSSKQKKLLFKLFGKSLEQVFTSHVTEDNIAMIRPGILVGMLINASTASTIIKTITKKNIQNLAPIIIERFLGDDMPKEGESFATILASSITRDNFKKVHVCVIKSLYSANDTCKKMIEDIACTVKNDNDLLDIYLYDPNKSEKQLFCQQTLGDQAVTQKTFSYQHFRTTHKAIARKFSARLQTDPKARITILDMLKHEKTEYAKSRYMLYHARASNCFIPNQIFIELLELYYGKPIDRNNWYTMHHNAPGKNFPYSKLQKIVNDGRDKNIGTKYVSGPERSYMQFFSDLFGVKRGSSALSYALQNGNAGQNRGSHKLELLFDIFGWGKYCQAGAAEFKKAEELAKKIKYGTMLAYSFTPTAIQKFTYATHESGGYMVTEKGNSAKIKIDGKEVSDAKMVLDTLVENPENFDKQKKKYEYIMMIADDHPTDKTKLGSANPFNKDIRIKHFNFGDDAKIAQQIKELIKVAFMKIKHAMIQDGVIKENSPILRSKI